MKDAIDIAVSVGAIAIPYLLWIYGLILLYRLKRRGALLIVMSLMALKPLIGFLAPWGAEWFLGGAAIQRQQLQTYHAVVGYTSRALGLLMALAFASYARVSRQEHGTTFNELGLQSGE